MPKPLKKRRGEETDPSEWAHDMVQRSTAEPSQDERDQPEEFRSQLSAYMSKLGQKGGKVSGERRMENLTQEKRSEIALKAAQARWDRRADKKK